MGDILIDCGFEFVDGSDGEASELARGQLAKEPFDQIQPGRGRRGEMKMDARMPPQPRLDFRRLMSGIVVENHVDAQALCDPALQLGHELEKLIAAMPR